MYSGCYYQPVCHLIIIRMNSACKSTCIHLRLMYGWIQDVHQLLSGAAYPTGCSQPVDYLLCTRLTSMQQSVTIFIEFGKGSPQV